MYCANCGNCNPDDAEFCQNCGQELRLSDQTEESVPFAQDFAAPKNVQSQYKQDVFYPILRKHVFSGLFLAGIILFGISILFSIAGSIVTAATPWDDILKWLPEKFQPGLEQFAKAAGTSLISCSHHPISEIFYTLKTVISVLTIVGSIIGTISVILIFVGMLMTHSAAIKSARNGSLMRTGGLSMIKGVQVYILVITCIAAALVLLMFVLVFMFIPIIDSLMFKLPENLSSVLIGTSVVLIGVFVLLIVYRARVVGMLSKIRNFAAGGAPYMKPSVFVIVIGFTGIVFRLVLTFGMLLLFPLSFALGIIIAEEITNTAATVLLLTVLCRYRVEMKRASLMKNVQPLSF